MIIYRKITKRVLAFVMALMILFCSVIGSVHKAYAASAVIVPTYTVAAEQVVAGLLSLLGISIAYDNRAQIQEAVASVYADFKEWCVDTGEIAVDTVEEWIESGRDGLISLKGEFAGAWKAFKTFCVETYYKVFFDAIVGDLRPDITSWPAKDDELATFLGYYTDDDAFPYYLVIDRTNKFGSSNTSVAAVFSDVPLIWYDGESLEYMRATTGSGTIVAWEYDGYRYNSNRHYMGIRDITLNDNLTTTITKYLYADALEIMQSNIPVFSSKDAAQLWWNENYGGGVIAPSTDIPIVQIPDTAADVIWNRDETLDNYDVIGSNSYVDASGNVIASDVAIPTWETIVGVGAGTATWEDVMSGNIAVDIPQDGVLDDAITIPSDKTETGENIKNELNSTQTMAPFLADLTSVFPFCIPFDLIDCIRLFNTEADAPRFEWTLSIRPFIDYEYTFVIDLSVFDEVATICRALMCVLFIVGLASATRNLIRG